MAFGIKINGAYLDLAENSTITFKKNAELWVTGDAEFTEGSYSFPLTVPLTDHNNYHLRFPGRIDSFTPMYVGPATLYVGDGMSIGVPMYAGDLYVKKGSNTTASIFLIVNGLGSKKDLSFKDVDMGSGSKGEFSTLVDLMDDTTIHPLDHDFVFFPVWNETLPNSYDPNVYDQWPNGVLGMRYQNHHRSGEFMIADGGLARSGNSIVTPFLRLKPIMAKAAEALGYTIINDWLTEEELELICIYNNTSINSLEALPADWNPTWLYSKHLPDMKITEFFKKITKWMFVGLFIDEVYKTIRLVPYKNVLAQAPRHNWTRAAQYEYETEQDNKVPKWIGYAQDGSDQYFSNNFVSQQALLAEGVTIDDYWEATGNPNSHSLSDGYYSVKRDRSVVKYDESQPSLTQQWTKFVHRFSGLAIAGRGAEYKCDVIPLFSDSGNPTFGAYAFGWSVPRADIALNATFDVSDEIVNLQGAMSSLRVCIYRGMRNAVTASGSDLYPYANATAYDPTNEDDTFDYSLHYDGDRGIYQRFGKEWIHFMTNKKIVNRKLNLTIADVLNHKEYDIIRIDNMNYFITSMTITFTSSGMELVDCEMVTIPAIGMM